MRWLHRIQQYVAITEAEARDILIATLLLAGGFVAREVQERAQPIPPSVPAQVGLTSRREAPPPDTLVLDLNRATAAELETLPGIGPALAGRIIEYRNSHGRFRNVAELDAVKGIGPKTIARLKPRLRVQPDTH